MKLRFLFRADRHWWAQWLKVSWRIRTIWTIEILDEYVFEHRWRWWCRVLRERLNGWGYGGLR